MLKQAEDCVLALRFTHFGVVFMSHAYTPLTLKS